ncbi:ribonuclease H-like domain-containing protein [Tanacetum coccineum]|uniref:Ribonuclease H-like domain-containing protein n=1 Tax=Tanacetum coccineum TaxID=301880 RepID=A0ABQ5D907_9ASTR
MHDLHEPHFNALKHILRYVRGTVDCGLELHVSSTAQLTAYTDANWAGCPVARRSTSEYRGVANVVAEETAWIRNLLLILQRIIDILHSEFAITNLGSLNYFLGIFAQPTACGMFLSQSKFAEEIPERAHLSYVVQQVCLYMHDPHEPHFNALKRILCYVRGTVDCGLELHVSSTAQLTAYTDADWAGCPVARRSTSGYCLFLGDSILSRYAKRLVTLSRSSAEAEYRGVANVVAEETAWICNLLRELHTPLFTTTLVYCDNVSAVYMSANPVQHQRTKHIEIDIHFVRDIVAKGQVRVLHVPSRFQYVDIFTKGLPAALLLEFRSSSNIRRPPV